ncbi:MAG TPA: hypothetical protein VH643_23730 [Gemmataceae bacterium]|jgi:hypothetical protein
MQQFLSCPKCQARLRPPANTPRTQVRCGSCGHVFAVETPPDEALDAILLEDEPKEMLDALSADDEPSRPPRVVPPTLRSVHHRRGLPGACFTCWP